MDEIQLNKSMPTLHSTLSILELHRRLYKFLCLSVHLSVPGQVKILPSARFTIGSPGLQRFPKAPHRLFLSVVPLWHEVI